MPAKTLIGSGPVTGVNKLGGQYGIPLALLGVKEDGTIDISRISPLPESAQETLAALYRTGALAAGTAIAPVLAFKLTAETPGAAGNAIKLDFSNVQPDAAKPKDTKVDVKVTAVDKRKGLTVASVGTELGTPTGGAAPGLVALEAAAAKLPAAMTATKLSGTPLALVVPASTGDAFKLVAAGADPLLADLSVAIEDVDTGAGTFTLIFSVDHSAASVKLGDLDAELNPLVAVAAGPDGFAPPIPGKVTLAGGADPKVAAATPAEVQVLST